MSKNIAYFDCFSGISGDMCLGAIVDAGVSLSEIDKELKKINIKGYKLVSKKVQRANISATKVDVLIKKTSKKKLKPESKKWADIERLILSSRLPKDIKEKGLCIFRILFQAEANVHGVSFRDAHLHELSGIDCIIDIFGTIIGLNILGVEKIYVSPINLGSGDINTSHGILPVPAPATLELLKDYPIYSSNIPFELTTPTGASIISGLLAVPIPIPDMKLEKIGYGAGKKDLPNRPNVLRILIGKETNQSDEESIVIMETNIDDMNPQIYENVVEKLFDAGALDVFLENIIMKKGRPAIKLSVLLKETELEKISNILFNETTTIGVRFYKAFRKTLPRDFKRIKTEYGNIRVKRALLDDEFIKLSVEYDDLKKLSKETGIEIKKIEEIFKYLLSNCIT
jgi:uncharacterized protein (TIGR00299 family) protein